MFLPGLLHLHWGFGLFCSQMVLIWFLWKILFCFVLYLTTVRYLCTASSRASDDKYAFGGQWKPWETPVSALSPVASAEESPWGLTLPAHESCSLFPKPAASPPPTCTGLSWGCVLLQLFLMKQSLKTQPWPSLLSKGERQRQQAGSHLILRLETGAWFLK